MKSLIINFIATFSALTFAPVISEAGINFAMENVSQSNSSINFNDINVSYDLRLLFGDVNHDNEISASEYRDFDFSSLDFKAEDPYKDFKFLAMKPDGNTLYFYFATNYLLDIDNCIVNAVYSDSTKMNDDFTSYIENIKSEQLDIVNYYSYGTTFFYKAKINNFSNNYVAGNNIRILLQSIQIITNEENKLYNDLKETELIYPVGTDWTSGNFYYFENNTYFYKAKLATAFGVVEDNSYYPRVSAFGFSNEAKDTTVTNAKEITYMFVDFDDQLNLEELISVNVEYYKLKFDYIRRAKLENYNKAVGGFWDWVTDENNVYADIYAGKYYSNDYGALENGISTNGLKTNLSDYDENVVVFEADGNSKSIELNYTDILTESNNSGTSENKIISGSLNSQYVLDRLYNPDLTTLYNGFENVEILNNGRPYKKTIESDYNQEDYHYMQVTNSSSYWQHEPYIRTYDFKPIINLATYQQDLANENYSLSRSFIYQAISSLSDEDFQPNFAILIDGTNSDSDSSRSVVQGETINIKTRESVNGLSVDTLDTSIVKCITTGHEIYGATLIEATARQNNGSLITFNCIGNPAYTKYLSFVGYEAPVIFDLILNDINTWINDFWQTITSNPIVKTILIIIGVILLVIVLSLVIRLIKWIIKTIKKAFK